MNTGQDAGPDGHREAQKATNIATWEPDETNDGIPLEVLEGLAGAIGQRLADLTAERDDWKARYHEALRAGVADVECVTAERDAARASCAALVEALTKYGRHLIGPPCWGSIRCSCGLADALATYGAAGAALLERLAALERVQELMRLDYENDPAMFRDGERWYMTSFTHEQFVLGRARMREALAAVPK